MHLLNLPRRGGGEGASYISLYGHPRGVTLSGLGYEKVEIALFEVYERVGIFHFGQ